MKLSTALLLAAFAAPAALAANVAHAQAAQSDDQAAQQIINDMNPATYNIYGLTPPPKSIKDLTVQGGRSIAIPVTGKGNVWDISANVPITKPIKAGDNLQIMFYAKLAKADPGVTTARIAAAQIQLAAAPYSTVMSQSFDVTPEWQLFTVSGKADKDYAGGTLNAAFHLNTGKYTIALGLVAVFDKGQ